MNTLDKLAEIRQLKMVYAILFRNAGVALEFAEERRESSANRFGLVVYAYYPTIEECIDAEYERLHAA